MKKLKDKSKKLAKAIGEYTPIVGSVIDNLQSEDGGKGKIERKKLMKSIARIAGTIILTLLSKKLGVDLPIPF